MSALGRGLRVLALAGTSLALLGLGGCSDKSANAAAKQERAGAFDTAMMDALLQGAIDAGETVGVSALVFDEGRVVYQNAFGMADKARGVPVTEDTVFRIYSMTKPITSVVIMQLIDEGKLALDDPAAKFIPQLAKMPVYAGQNEDGSPKFAAQSRAFTVRDLLTHRSGLAYGIFGDVNPLETAYGKAGLFDPSETMATKMDRLASLPLVAQPGELWYYSYGIDVLGRIAEVIEGQTLGEIFQARIFKPLGMTQTGFFVTPEQKPRFATNYMPTSEGLAVQEDGQSSPFLTPHPFQSGGGGLVSTLDDYRKFSQAMLGGGVLDGVRILPKARIDEMMSNQMGEEGTFTYAFPWDEKGAVRFGFGGAVVVGDDEALSCAKGLAKGQWGWSGAARTKFHIDPNANSFAIIMMQQFQTQDPALHDRFRALVWKQTRNSHEDWCKSDKASAAK